MLKIYVTFGLLAAVSATPAVSNKDVNTQGYKDQYCTDPRTMRKHAAYTEWADAYSCTRHRCQPGGRNLAIYTVGCKRVEAPESAIECEEVVEDTNMQFPFCCTRLRCLVVVRGEVWTRVLGQPWEVLPAAPWSHMYKMKKPPPQDTTFQPKANEQGPVYELAEPENEGGNHEKVLRSARKSSTDSPDCNEVVPRANAIPPATPDIVIALSTGSENKEMPKKAEVPSRRQSPQNNGIAWQTQPHDSDAEHKRVRKNPESNHYFEKEEDRDHHQPEIIELDETQASTEKPPEVSEEKFYGNAFGHKEKQTFKNGHHQSWTEIPQTQWNEHEGMDVEPRASVMELRYTQEPTYHQPEVQPEVEKTERKEEKSDKPNNLQALVDAIGTRMRDIENVVQRMSEKVHQTKSPGGVSVEKRVPVEPEFSKHHKVEVKEAPKTKHEHEREHTGLEDDRYKQRFSIRGRGSKYLHATETTSEQPLYIEDNTNYFSDASNAVRRASQPKEPAQSAPTYMAPVENHRKSPSHITAVSDTSEDQERKKRKHSHKRRKNKAHAHKKHHSQDKRKHFNKLASVELDKNAVSMEDSSSMVK